MADGHGLTRNGSGVRTKALLGLGFDVEKSCETVVGVGVGGVSGELLQECYGGGGTGIIISDLYHGRDKADMKRECENGNGKTLAGDKCGRTEGGDTEFFSSEDECRKKRCVDRYDSSESSDSGVAVSCTDCSGSSTASSDITDPGSPCSTSSANSEDSGSSCTNAGSMTPTQGSPVHPIWPWNSIAASKSSPSAKRPLQDKTEYLKQEIDSCDKIQVVVPNNATSLTKCKSSFSFSRDVVLKSSPKVEKLVKKTKKKVEVVMNAQPKITEYFKSQAKCNFIRKDYSTASKNCQKSVQLSNTTIDPVRQNSFKQIQRNIKTQPIITKKQQLMQVKAKRSATVVPRKILPAPSKVPDKLTAISNHVGNIAGFTPAVALTAVGFPPNLTYLHTKTPKPADNLVLQQFTAITSDNKMNTIPLISRSPCLNVLQPMQKITTINNFSCVKLNATVVPVVNLNNMPSRLNGSPNLTVSVDTALPTVLSAKPKFNGNAAESVGINTSCSLPCNQLLSGEIPQVDNTITDVLQSKYRMETDCQTEDHRAQDKCKQENRETKEKVSNDSDSGYSNKESGLDGFLGSRTESVKSPILSQPKTIRFPARNEIKEEAKEVKLRNEDRGYCKWHVCNAQFETSGALLDHLQEKHVISQASQEQYECLWKSCKVYGQKSCSRAWLERHVLAHAGKKPFRCIVEGCGQRFSSQSILERHVNSHFNADGTQNNNGKRTAESPSVKLIKKNGKKLRFRRQPWSARMFDFMDSGMMEGLQYRLLTLTERRTQGQVNCPGDSLQLKNQVMARRTEPGGGVKILVRWHPLDILPDEWVNEKDYSPTKQVPISSLDSGARNVLKTVLFDDDSKNDTSPGPVRQKHYRKPRKAAIPATNVTSISNGSFIPNGSLINT